MQACAISCAQTKHVHARAKNLSSLALNTKGRLPSHALPVGAGRAAGEELPPQQPGRILRKPVLLAHPGLKVIPLRCSDACICIDVKACLPAKMLAGC